MDGLKAYKYFMAVKLHFTTDKYDVFQSGANVRCSRETFEKRNDRYFFEKLAKKFSKDQELIQFFVSNFAYGNKNVIYSQDSDEYYQKWLMRKESRTQCFRNDMSVILNHLELNRLTKGDLYSIEGNTPELLSLYVGSHVSLETMIILQDFDDYLRTWEPMIMLWHNHFLIIRKAKRFVKYDSYKIQSIYQEYMELITELQK